MKLALPHTLGAGKVGMGDMKAVVVGGHTRNIGKTSVMAGLIREFAALNWTAVKITQYGHGICSLDGRPCECAPREHAFVLTEEEDASGKSDTSRYLASGARRALWLRVRQGQLGEAFPILQEALASADYAMIESNSILGFLRPHIYLMVLDSSVHDFKASALQYVERADALIPIGSRLDGLFSPKSLSGALGGKPVFPVPARQYYSHDLCCFVSGKLGVPLLDTSGH